jgi:hypothetical protein
LIPWHELWHVVVLGSTLLAGATAFVLLLGPALLGHEPPNGRTRGVAYGFLMTAAGLMAAEWILVH